MRAYVRSRPCFNIFAKLKIAKLKFTETLDSNRTGTLAVILFAGADDATADSDVGKNIGEEPGNKKTRLESDYDELFGPHYTSKKKRADSTCPEEVEEYFRLPRISTTSNPLEWWARKEKQFPRLAKLARIYLAIPATSTPSERVFPLAGNTITRQRASLHPAHLDALVFLNANQERKNRIIKEEDFEESE